MEGEDAAVVTTGAVEMTDAVLVVAEPIVVPGERKDSCEVNNSSKVVGGFLGILAYQ